MLGKWQWTSNLPMRHIEKNYFEPDLGLKAAWENSHSAPGKIWERRFKRGECRTAPLNHAPLENGKRGKIIDTFSS